MDKKNIHLADLGTCVFCEYVRNQFKGIRNYKGAIQRPNKATQGYTGWCKSRGTVSSADYSAVVGMSSNIFCAKYT